MCKLQNFNKKVFCIGIQDDMFTSLENRKSDSFKLSIARNSLLIRNFIKEADAENVVLELCDERYENDIGPVLAHPNYD